MRRGLRVGGENLCQRGKPYVVLSATVRTECTLAWSVAILL